MKNSRRIVLVTKHAAVRTIMKKRRSHPYYDWDRLLSYYPAGFRIFISVGEGGVGKTYSAFGVCKNRLKRQPTRKMLLVRDAENVLDAFNSEDGKETLVKHFCVGRETIVMDKADLWLCDITDEQVGDKEKGTDKTIEVVTRKRHLGAMAALSTFYKPKGIERAKAGYDTIFIDEFIQESRQAVRIDAVRAFYRTLQNTLRTNPDAVVLLAANLVNDSPLWDIFECRPGKVGEITSCAKTGVVIEHVEPSADWLELHRKSVAGRLGIDDSKRDKYVNPNIRPLHKERGMNYTMNMCRHLTNDGNDKIWIFTTEQFTQDKTGRTQMFRNYYCCSDTVGKTIYDKHVDRGMRRNGASAVTTFGFIRRPRSYFEPFQNIVNDIIFEDRLTLQKFQRICK